MVLNVAQQYHAIKSSVQTIAELDDRLREVEEVVRSPPLEATKSRQNPLHTDRGNPHIDAVIVSHEFTDHCNKNTLLELDPDTPIFATKHAADLIRSWNYFSLVQYTPPFSADKSDWRTTSLYPLPDWVGVARMVTQSDLLYYHSAILVTFELHSNDNNHFSKLLGSAEAVIYTPHGIHWQDLSPLQSSSPPIKTLALLHGLHDIKISIKQLNLGAHNGLQAQRICQARYWVSTHDEVKTAAGLVAPLLYRKSLTLQEALEAERRDKGEVTDDSELADVRRVTFSDLSSGESLLLD
ncbi:hypothetical protein MMC21_000808 [Puttea exsequens]|nr:hypothetical protein [Puttea exsequens]